MVGADMTETTPSHFTDFFCNVSLLSALAAWTVAQSIKFSWNLFRTGTIDFGYFVSTGGMPSAHSAMVSGLATSIGLRTGLGSATFAVCLCFALVVMFDAQSVRRAAGQQARLLNQIVAEFFKEHHLSKQKMAEFLGHTRTEVFAGMFLGILTALLVHAVS